MAQSTLVHELVAGAVDYRRSDEGVQYPTTTRRVSRADARQVCAGNRAHHDFSQSLDPNRVAVHSEDQVSRSLFRFHGLLPLTSHRRVYALVEVAPLRELRDPTFHRCDSFHHFTVAFGVASVAGRQR